MLVVLFYFLGSIFYFLVVIIAILSLICICFTIYPVVEKLFAKIFSDGEGPFFNVPKLGRIYVQHILVLLIAIGLILTWIFTGFWLIVDGIACCIGITQLSIIRLNNLKVSVILLSLFLVYDVFWVFLSPILFGTSVMVAVATKVTSSLPLAFTMPHILGNGYSLLGLGDVVIPGLFICFVYGFEDTLKQLNKSKPGISYFAVVLIGYSVGFASTLISFMIMEKGQPALLYLAPFSLIPVILTAWYRGQLREMWTGVHREEASTQLKMEEIVVEQQGLLSGEEEQQEEDRKSS